MLRGCACAAGGAQLAIYDTREAISLGKYVMALDQGTTSSRAIVFDKGGHILAKAQREFEQVYPNAGWVEHDPMEILYSQLQSVATVLASGEVDAKEIAAVGLPTSARRRSSGIKQPASQFITRSSGSAAARRIIAHS